MPKSSKNPPPNNYNRAPPPNDSSRPPPSNNSSRAPPHRKPNSVTNPRLFDNNHVYLNPNSKDPQVTALLTKLFDHLNTGYPTLDPAVQQQPQLHGQATNALYRQPPSLYGQGGFLGWQPPPLLYPGSNGGLPQQYLQLGNQHFQ